MRVIEAFLAKGISKPFLSGDGWEFLGTRLFANPVTKNFKGYMTTVWDCSVPTPRSKKFVANYYVRFHMNPDNDCPVVYDAVMLLAQVIRNVKSADRGKIEEALQNLKRFEGVSGKMIFRL